MLFLMYKFGISIDENNTLKVKKLYDYKKHYRSLSFGWAYRDLM